MSNIQLVQLQLGVFFIIGIFAFLYSFSLKSEQTYRLQLRYVAIAFIGLPGFYITFTLLFPLNLLFAFFPSTHQIIQFFIEVSYGFVGYIFGTAVANARLAKQVISALLLLFFPIFTSSITIVINQAIGAHQTKQLMQEGYYTGPPVSTITSSDSLEKIYKTTLKFAIPYEDMAKNPNTPDYIRQEILRDHPFVISNLAGDPKTAPILLNKVYYDAANIKDNEQKLLVYYLLAANPTTPIDILERLSKFSDAKVATKAKESLEQRLKQSE